MKTIIKILMALLRAIECAVAAAHDWLDDRLGRPDDALQDIAEMFEAGLDQSRVDRYIDSHRVGMPPRGRR